MVLFLPLIVALTTVFLLAVFTTIYHTNSKIPTNTDRRGKTKIEQDESKDNNEGMSNEEDSSQTSLSSASQSSEEEEPVVNILHRSITDTNSLKCGEFMQIGGSEKEQEVINQYINQDETESSLSESETDNEWLEETESSMSIEYSEDDSTTTDFTIEHRDMTQRLDCGDQQEQVDNENMLQDDTKSQSFEEEGNCQSTKLQETATTYLYSHDGNVHRDEVRVISLQSSNVGGNLEDNRGKYTGVKIQSEPSYISFTAHT